MSSYQASVEFEFNQESSDSDLSETADVILKVPVKVRFSRNQTHSTQNQKVLHMDEPLADENWIAERSSEVQEAEQRNQALQNRFDIIEGLDTW